MPLENVPIPAEIENDPEAMEMARVWVSDGGLVVSLRMGFTAEGPDGVNDEASAWAALLAAMTHHAAQAIAEEGELDERTAMDQIRGVYTQGIDLLLSEDAETEAE